MLATIKMDAMGNLHVWKGFRHIHSAGNHLYHDRRDHEADMFLQAEADIEAFMDSLSAEHVQQLGEGWTVYTMVSDEWFPSENAQVGAR